MRILYIYKELILALAVSLFLTFIVSLSVTQMQPERPELSVKPDFQDIYVLGNSMFGTGFSLTRAREKMPEKKIDFAYYNGHYTSMWHLAVSVGMDDKSAPKTIVWGFRPTYAIYPSFRQNKKTEQANFSKLMGSLHRSILSNAGDPAYSAAGKRNEIVSVGSSNFGYQEPFETLGSKIAYALESNFEVLSEDASFLDTIVSKFSVSIASFAISVDMVEINALFNDDALIRPSDLLIRYVSDGKLQVADAQVIDNGERFISGRSVEFSESFIPHIAMEIDRLGSDQLVVIFRPVSTYKNPFDEELERFYKDALAFFEKENIQVLDLNMDPNLTLDMFAEGDHLNEKGRIFVTDRIVEKLN